MACLVAAAEVSHNIAQMYPLPHVNALARQHFVVLIVEDSQMDDLHESASPASVHIATIVKVVESLFE